MEATKWWIVLLLITLLLTASVAAAPSQAEVQHFNMKGGQLFVSWNDGLFSTHISVITNTQGSPPAFLVFEQALGCDPEWTPNGGCRYLIGSGALPPNTVRITPGGASLSVDIGKVQGFLLFELFCPYGGDPDGFPLPCKETPRAGDTVDLTWTKKGPPTTFISGIQRSTYGTFSFTQNGHRTSSLAIVSGSAFSSVVPANTQGLYSTDSNVIVSVTKD